MEPERWLVEVSADRGRRLPLRRRSRRRKDRERIFSTSYSLLKAQSSSTRHDAAQPPDPINPSPPFVSFRRSRYSDGKQIVSSVSAALITVSAAGGFTEKLERSDFQSSRVFISLCPFSLSAYGHQGVPQREHSPQTAIWEASAEAETHCGDGHGDRSVQSSVGLILGPVYRREPTINPDRAAAAPKGRATPSSNTPWSVPCRRLAPRSPACACPPVRPAPAA